MRTERPRLGSADVQEPLGVLLLPGTLEGFALEAHARELLSIPRVIALEPSRVRTPRFMVDAVSARQARKLRLPGRPALLVLYHPAQYPLARALRAQYEPADLWYVRSDPQASGIDAADNQLLEFDELARAHATRTLDVDEGPVVPDEPLRLRMRELEVISPRPFIPGGRVHGS